MYFNYQKIWHIAPVFLCRFQRLEPSSGLCWTCSPVWQSTQCYNIAIYCFACPAVFVWSAKSKREKNTEVLCFEKKQDNLIFVVILSIHFENTNSETSFKLPTWLLVVNICNLYIIKPILVVSRVVGICFVLFFLLCPIFRVKLVLCGHSPLTNAHTS